MRGRTLHEVVEDMTDMTDNEGLVETTKHEIVVRPSASLTIDQLRDRVGLVHSAMRSVMKEGVHYGTVPGCGDKPMLKKPGAEVLCLLFQLASSYQIEEREGPGGHREFRVTCTLVHAPSGTFCGQGIGICSTMESRYRWRKSERCCPTCGGAFIIKGREEYGGGWLCFAKKGGCGAKFRDGDRAIEAQETGRVENPDLADCLNTVIKMAKKRALHDAVLTATGASELLSTDMDDFVEPAEQERPREKPKPGANERLKQRVRPATDPQPQEAPTTRETAWARLVKHARELWGKDWSHASGVDLAKLSVLCMEILGRKPSETERLTVAEMHKVATALKARAERQQREDARTAPEDTAEAVFGDGTETPAERLSRLMTASGAPKGKGKRAELIGKLAYDVLDREPSEDEPLTEDEMTALANELELRAGG